MLRPPPRSTLFPYPTPFRSAGPLIGGHPRVAGYSAAVAEAALAGPYEIAIVGPDAADLIEAAHHAAPPGTVIVAGEPDRPGVPLLADRPLQGGAATAYVCRGFVCDRPVTSIADLTARLTGG